jgi:hypothetical protein
MPSSRRQRLPVRRSQRRPHTITGGKPALRGNECPGWARNASSGTCPRDLRRSHTCITRSSGTRNRLRHPGGAQGPGPGDQRGAQNAVIHAYLGQDPGMVVETWRAEEHLVVRVTDQRHALIPRAHRTGGTRQLTGGAQPSRMSRSSLDRRQPSASARPAVQWRPARPPDFRSPLAQRQFGGAVPLGDDLRERRDRCRLRVPLRWRSGKPRSSGTCWLPG